MKSQKIDIDKIILGITAPDGVTAVKIVSPSEFAMQEVDKKEVDYCTIVGANVVISKKAEYSHVLINYAT